jgi:hypothetical protein
MWGFTNRRAAKLLLTDKSKQNPNSNGAMAMDYKWSREGCASTPGHNPNGLGTIHGPKARNGGTASRQILDVQLF